MNGNKQSFFNSLSNQISAATGKPITFVIAVTIVLVWAITGPIFNYSDTWQLVINTGTTIITFLMVFLIQNTQNRDTIAMQLKLDELILSIKEARNEMVDLDSLDEKDLQDRKKELVEQAKASIEDAQA